eukprot:TRINITY_DN110281_c0_g1_i1.p1 TRINITY_DN110281_c0_g1~~TRINITY_DN110281_c0_g1_i1.p1  ORF type:complete len:326 (-),score=68.67 TRINITY_DN110281_c0_g1_i1:148-1125(-)
MAIEDMKVWKVFGCGTCCLLTLFTIVAIPVSLKTLEQGEYALTLNWNTQKIGSETINKPGMMFVGLGNMLVKYPSTFQTMYFSAGRQGIQGDDDEDNIFAPIVTYPVRARTADGLDMTVAVSFQWRLEPQSLIPLYGILGDIFYRDEFVRFARAAIIETCSYFSADMYFTNRTQITNRMLDELKGAFQRPDKGLQVQIKGLQMAEVDLPNEFDKEISNTQEQMQEVEVATAEREEKRISMERELLIAQEKVLEILEAARGEAARIKLDNDARVDQEYVYQSRQANANNLIAQKFVNDSNPYMRLFELMEIRALKGHDADKLLYKL